MAHRDPKRIRPNIALDTPMWRRAVAYRVNNVHAPSGAALLRRGLALAIAEYEAALLSGAASQPPQGPYGEQVTGSGGQQQPSRPTS